MTKTIAMSTSLVAVVVLSMQTIGNYIYVLYFGIRRIVMHKLNTDNRSFHSVEFERKSVHTRKLYTNRQHSDICAHKMLAFDMIIIYFMGIIPHRI